MPNEDKPNRLVFKEPPTGDLWIAVDSTGSVLGADASLDTLREIIQLKVGSNRMDTIEFVLAQRVEKVDALEGDWVEMPVDPTALPN